MKYLMLLIPALIFNVSYGQISIKPAVGFSITDLSEDIEGVKAKYGAQVGASVAFNLNDNFFIEPGLFSTSKSTEFETNSTTASVEAYVEGLRIPISVGYIIIGDVDTFINLRVFGGPSGYFVTNVGKDVNKSDFKRFNFGVYSGAGLDIWRLFLEISYEWSLSNIQKDVTGIDLGKHRSLYVNVGYKIKF